MSGCEADFAIHLQAADKLRASRHQWSIMSGASRQLNEISSFLSLLARTLSFAIISTPWTPGTLENEERSNIAMVKPHNCFPYMYGTTSTIASAIQRSCQLSEYLSYYRNVDTESYIPESLLEACESLGDTLLCWTLASETLPTSITEDPDNLATFNNHATAWHLAALIYYYRCIQSLPSSHYREKVRKVAEKMHALEDLKESPSSRALPNSEESSSPFTMAPITWPAFIASCEAMEPDRDIWRSWWGRVQCYRIANTGQQWDVVKRIWEERDRIEKHTGLGIGSSDWREIYRGWKISLLPI